MTQLIRIVHNHLMRPSVILGAILISLAVAPAALYAERVPVRIEIVSPNASEEEATEGWIEATAIDSSGEGAAEVLRFPRLRVPGDTTIALDDDHVWKLRSVAEGFWSPSAVLQPTRRNLRLESWRTGTIRGSIRVPRDRPEPQSISARFEPPPEPSGTKPAPGDLPQAKVECPIEDGEFVCEVPAVAIDLRMRAKGFVSHYFWRVPVRPDEPVDLGALDLSPGASVVGFVAAAEGRVSPQKARVVLAPEASAAARTPTQERRRAAGDLETKVNDRGFFHFEGVAPGQYRVAASQPGLADAVVHPVQVLPGSETTLRDPLLMERPAELQVYLEPPQDPYGQAWHVELRQFGPIPGILDIVREGQASLAGEYLAGGLSPGRFVVAVSDSQGARFGWEELEIDRGNTPLFLTLDVLWIEGDVTLGEDPLEAELIFGGRHAPVQIPISTDEDGELGGFLPEAGEWEVFVEATSPPVSKTVSVEVVPGEDERYAEVDITLPDTRVQGKVIDVRGRPVPRAVVKATEMEQGRITWQRSDQEGRFSFHGFEEGPLALDATLDEDLSSDPAVIQVSEDMVPPEVELTIRQRVPLRGVVVSSSGPVPGAAVMAIPKRGGIEFPFMRRPQAVTGVRGEFELALPEDADRTELVVMPPGFALTIHAVNGIPDDEVRLPVVEHGGTLTLSYGSPSTWQTERRAPSPMVVVDGVVLDGTVLARWARLKLEDNADLTRTIVPQMPPGSYTACWITYERLAQTYTAPETEAPFPGRECTDGYLPPYGTLELVLSASENPENETLRE